MIQDALMTVVDVATYLKLNKQTVYRMIKENRLPYIKVGWNIRFRKSDVDSIIEVFKTQEVTNGQGQLAQDKAVT